MSSKGNYHSLPGGAGELHDVEKTRTPRWIDEIKDTSPRYWAWARLVAELLLLTAVVLLSLRVVWTERTTVATTYQGPNDPKKTFGFTDRVFMNDTRFANEDAFLSEENMAETLLQWTELSSIGRGFVDIPTAERDTLDGRPYLMNPLMRPYKREIYMMSGLHQLHCLSTIMHSYGKLRLGKDESQMGYHIAHCFDYLRQGILCAGDTTLEGNNSAKYPGVEIPWGTSHRCVNWDVMREWADERTVFPWPPGLDKIL